MNKSAPVQPTQAIAPSLGDPVHLLAFGFGSGLSRNAPGTAGTLAAVPAYLLLVQLPPAGYVLALVAGFIVGIYLCGRTAADLGVHDHPGIVWDEFVGYWLTMIALPPHWLWVGLGFVLFRLFDVLKPWPIRLLDRRVGGGFGIMLDDAAAALPAILCLQLLYRFTPLGGG